ncbi:magnesium chelatase subunit D [Muricoccus vinaceus]|uniref:Magnesium chelatase subunit D n=1 Tax=Muricoccus vinaceus TaxID=424704 RepID=A0ABV6J3P2_9PROT
MNDPAASAEAPSWADAALAACLLAVDPAGLGGAWLRARPGPLRDRWLAILRERLPPELPLRRLPANAPDSRVLGGLDLGATLLAGRPVVERGVLAECDGGIVVLAMVERLEPGAAARIAAVLDTGAVALERDGLARRLPARIGAVALDEGLADERPPAALTERLALPVALEGIAGPLDDPPHSPAAIAAARALLPHVRAAAVVAEALCKAAAQLGIASLRPPLMALRAARALAALGGREDVTAADATMAAALVLAPRALPTAEATPPEPAPEQDGAEPQDAIGEENEATGALAESVVAAARAAIPPGLLAAMPFAAASRGPGAAGRSGQPRRAARRGQPIGTAPGELRPGARISLVETLRAAAPWQALRRRTSDVPGLLLRKEDLRLTRFRQRTETTAIFAVDASGSSALHRLAEAKGAVELLLADCYARRDRVAVIAFRGTAATLLLPPTTSLTRARRGLAGLPGGGPTPVASGIDAAVALAASERRAGRTPLVVLLTDGQANIARDGTAGRARATEDATAAARGLRALGIAALLVDTAPRPQPVAARLAEGMGARYVPLPHAGAAALSGTVRAARGQTR